MKAREMTPEKTNIFSLKYRIEKYLFSDKPIFHQRAAKKWPSARPFLQP